MNSIHKKTNRSTQISRPVTAAIVLAAGRSQRMGNSNKLLQTIDQQPMLHNTLTAINLSQLTHCLVVTGFEAERIRTSVNQVFPPEKISCVHNPEYAAGMSTSLRTGLTALSSQALGVEAALIVLGDMPDITTAIIDQLLEDFNPPQGREICVPVFNDKRGNPVLWSRRFFAELCAVQGDKGGRELLHEHAASVYESRVDNPAIHCDIDTPEALYARQMLSQ